MFKTILKIAVLSATAITLLSACGAAKKALGSAADDALNSALTKAEKRYSGDIKNFIDENGNSIIDENGNPIINENGDNLDAYFDYCQYCSNDPAIRVSNRRTEIWSSYWGDHGRYDTFTSDLNNTPRGPLLTGTGQATWLGHSAYRVVGEGSQLYFSFVEMKIFFNETISVEMEITLDNNDLKTLKGVVKDRIIKPNGKDGAGISGVIDQYGAIGTFEDYEDSGVYEGAFHANPLID